MEIQQSRRMLLSFKNATIFITILNVITALFLLQGFISSSSSVSSRRNLPLNQLSSVQLKHIKEAVEMRLAMQPLELIKRVKEIQQEAHEEPESVQQKDTRQTAAVDLSKRLKDFRAINDAASLKALEEWRKRKMERARQRELEKNVTATISQA